MAGGEGGASVPVTRPLRESACHHASSTPAVGYNDCATGIGPRNEAITFGMRSCRMKACQTGVGTALHLTILDQPAAPVRCCSTSAGCNTAGASSW